VAFNYGFAAHELNDIEDIHHREPHTISGGLV
jgi:hypothetical protein